MARKKVEKEEKKEALTRAQKTEATKAIVKELLSIKPMRHNELIDEVAKEYALRHGGADTENINDVKGRVGSVLDIMKKVSEVANDGGTYALKARLPMENDLKAEEKKPVKKTAKKKKEETLEENPPAQTAEETPAVKKRGRPKKAQKADEESAEEVKTAPATEKPAKKPTRAKAKKAEGTPAQPVQTVEKAEEKAPEVALAVLPKAEIAPKAVMDMSFLFGAKSQKGAPKTEGGSKAEKAVENVEKAADQTKKVEKPKAEGGKSVKSARQPRARSATKTGKAEPLTADEKLRESFLKKLRTLSGEYFEYYSVYLLEKYARKNGRRLEGMKISGGDHDGGIDGEIELTDKLGFRETIYIQSKNWNPSKGKGEKWVVGETLLQQFIGACVCRQARDGKQHARGIFITTSRYTPEAKRILETTSDKIVGYDGNDLYETAKECEFGLIKKDGEWALDEKLLSGEKVFFGLY